MKQEPAQKNFVYPCCCMRVLEIFYIGKEGEQVRLREHIYMGKRDSVTKVILM